MKRFMASAAAAGLALGVAAAWATGPASGMQQSQQPVANASVRMHDAKPVEALEAAAQRLRDAIHALATAPAGAERSQAIHDGNRALLEVNQAMAELPPDLLTAQADEPAYRQAVDRLEQAAQRLRDAAHALAADQNSPRRNDSIKAVNRALLETQQAMIDVPLVRVPSHSAAAGYR